MIAVAEIGGPLLIKSDEGYNVLVGSTAKYPILFESYADHPRRLIEVRDKAGKLFKSSAAGRYQILARYYDAYKKQLGLKDFGKAAQDAIAVQMIRECKALPLIETGHIEAAIEACRSRWASLPGAGYGQNEQKTAFLVEAFKANGGRVAAV